MNETHDTASCGAFHRGIAAAVATLERHLREFEAAPAAQSRSEQMLDASYARAIRHAVCLVGSVLAPGEITCTEPSADDRPDAEELRDLHVAELRKLANTPPQSADGVERLLWRVACNACAERVEAMDVRVSRPVLPDAGEGA